MACLLHRRAFIKASSADYSAVTVMDSFTTKNLVEWDDWHRFEGRRKKQTKSVGTWRRELWLDESIAEAPLRSEERMLK